MDSADDIIIQVTDNQVSFTISADGFYRTMEEASTLTTEAANRLIIDQTSMPPDEAYRLLDTIEDSDMKELNTYELRNLLEMYDLYMEEDLGETIGIADQYEKYLGYKLNI